MILKEIKRLKRRAGEALDHQKRDREIPAGLSLSFCFHDPHLLRNLDRESIQHQELPVEQ